MTLHRLVAHLNGPHRLTHPIRLPCLTLEGILCTYYPRLILHPPHPSVLPIPHLDQPSTPLA